MDVALERLEAAAALGRRSATVLGDLEAGGRGRRDGVLEVRDLDGGRVLAGLQALRLEVPHPRGLDGQVVALVGDALLEDLEDGVLAGLDDVALLILEDELDELGIQVVGAPRGVDHRQDDELVVDELRVHQLDVQGVPDGDDHLRGVVLACVDVPRERDGDVARSDDVLVRARLLVPFPADHDAVRVGDAPLVVDELLLPGDVDVERVDGLPADDGDRGVHAHEVHGPDAPGADLLPDLAVVRGFHARLFARRRPVLPQRAVVNRCLDDPVLVLPGVPVPALAVDDQVAERRGPSVEIGGHVERALRRPARVDVDVLRQAALVVELRVVAAPLDAVLHLHEPGGAVEPRLVAGPAVATLVQGRVGLHGVGRGRVQRDAVERAARAEAAQRVVVLVEGELRVHGLRLVAPVAEQVPVERDVLPRRRQDLLPDLFVRGVLRGGGRCGRDDQSQR
jgi:hypothetical protein